MKKDFDKSSLNDLSEAILAGIIGSAMDAIIAVDQQQRVMLFNAAAETMFGRANAQMLGQPLAQLIPERFRIAHTGHIQSFDRTNVTRRRMGGLGAIYGLRANGEEFPIEASISQTEIKGQKILTVILRDITDRKRTEEALHSSAELIRAIAESSNDAIIGKTLEGVILSWNPGAEKLFGYTAQEALGKPMLMLIPPDRVNEEPAILARIARGERIEHFETVRVRKDGTKIDISATISPLKDASGKIIGASKIARDITERKLAHEKVLRLNRIHEVLSGINSLIVRVRDRQELFDAACRLAVEKGNFAAAWIGLLNPETEEITAAAWAGIHAEELARYKASARNNLPQGQGLVGRAFRERKPIFSNDLASDPDEPITQRMRASLDFGYRSLIALPLIVEGTVVGALELFAKERGLIDEIELRLLTELAGDISFALEHISNEERLHYLAYHDPLTGLGNRALLYERLEQAIRGAKHGNFKVALMFGDIKGFSKINESMGRQAGDTILKELAGRLKLLSPEPENVARISSDYFAGVISDFREISELAHLMEQSIGGLLSQPYLVGSKSFNISTRVGIAVFPIDGNDADTLFRNAEAALRNAKTAGGRYRFYQPEMNARVAEALHLEVKLRTAIDQEQFTLYYQPKINAADGNISGLEALIRWNDPDNGLVLPGKFIPLLEENGMILEVGAWVIRQALADYRNWSNKGVRPPRIAVNVSAAQLRQTDFVTAVRNNIGNAAHALDIEITESLLMDNIEDSMRKLKILSAMGINIAIDDFGTGYSSLSYLTHLPVNALKIDYSFVIKMTDDANSMAIVSSIISLAHSLNLKVIAEGVETEEHARFLRLLKCDELQGYFFSKPVPPEEIIKLLEAS